MNPCTKLVLSSITNDLHITFKLMGICMSLTSLDISPELSCRSLLLLEALLFPIFCNTTLLYVLFFFCLNFFFSLFLSGPLRYSCPLNVSVPQAHSQLPSLYIIIFTLSLDDLIHVHGLNNNADTHIFQCAAPSFILDFSSDL